jgi:hypothetical protein
MKIYRDIWSNCDDEKSVPLFGYTHKILPKPVYLNREELMLEGRKTFKQHSSVIQKILTENTFKELEDKMITQNDDFLLPIELWVKIIFEYSAYMDVHSENYNLLHSIIPLFLFRTYSLTGELDEKGMTHEEFTNKISLYCRTFEKMKDYLNKIWNNT